MAALQAIARAPTSEQRRGDPRPHRAALRARARASTRASPVELGVAVMTVKLWRRRYVEAGLDGLADAPRPGHPPTYASRGP